MVRWNQFWDNKRFSLWILGGPEELKKGHMFNAVPKRKATDRVKVRSLCRNRSCVMPSHLVLESETVFNARCDNNFDRCDHMPRCLPRYYEPHFIGIIKNRKRANTEEGSTSQIQSKDVKISQITIENVWCNYEELDDEDETEFKFATIKEEPELIWMMIERIQPQTEHVSFTTRR